MKISDNLWDEIGEIPEDEMVHVLTKLFLNYQTLIDNDPQNKQALQFFTFLDNAITQSRECNLNRR